MSSSNPNSTRSILSFLQQSLEWGEWNEHEATFDSLLPLAIPFINQVDTDVAQVLTQTPIKSFAGVYLSIQKHLFQVPVELREEFHRLLLADAINRNSIPEIPTIPGLYIIDGDSWRFAWGFWRPGSPIVVATQLLQRFPSFCHSLCHEGTHCRYDVATTTISERQRKEAETRALENELKLSQVLSSAISNNELDSKWIGDMQIANKRAKGMLKAL